MKKALVLLLACSLAGRVAAQDKEIKVESKLTAATVFLSGAQLRRTATVDLPAGASQLVFSGLSPDIEQQSIQVKGGGSFTITGVNRQSNYLEEQKSNDERRRLESQITSNRARLRDLADQLSIVANQEEILSKNQVVGSSAAGVDPVKLKAILDFQQAKLTELKALRSQIVEKTNETQEQLQQLLKQYSDIQGKVRKNTSDIVVKVSAQAAIRANVELTYLVKNAGWFPTYDVRARDVNSPVELVYKANVSQRSGEDWNNVKLTLSSGNPSVSGSKPELQPWLLGVNNPAAPIATSISGRVADAKHGSALAGVTVRVQNSSIGAATDADGRYSIQVPPDGGSLQFSLIGYAPQTLPVTGSTMNVRLQPDTRLLSEVVVVDAYDVAGTLAGKAPGLAVRGLKKESPTDLADAIPVDARETQTNIEFQIKDAYTVLSDGKQIYAEIGHYNVAADYEYSAVPKISPNAYLTARITGISRMNLLSGEANIFFEGTFLGKSLVNTAAINDTLAVSMGTDKSIVITREKTKDFNDKQFIGSSQRATRSFEITINNRKSQAVNLVVTDQVPVSTTEDVTVEKQEISGAQIDNFGRLTWRLTLQPGEQRKLAIRYQVKYPKTRNLIIE